MTSFVGDSHDRGKMKIDLLTRIKTQYLYDNMIESAKRNACGKIENHFEIDKEGLPLCAGTYNRLAKKSKADILCFVEDDVQFMSKGWDNVVKKIFREYKPDILGVVGATEYEGGGVFDAGFPYGVGIVVCNKNGANDGGGDYVKVLSPHYRYKKVKVIDGMIMFVNKKYWQREPFDEKFDQLFFYDADMCLRSSKVGITCDILIKHSTKPPELYGKYPEKMKTVKPYWKKLRKKYNFKNYRVGDMRCARISLEDFKKAGQNEVYQYFNNKFRNPLIQRPYA